MVSMDSKLLYQLEVLNQQNIRVNYQMSSGKALDNGSDDSKLYSYILDIEDNIKTYEGISTQLEKTTIFNDSSDSAISEMKTTMDAITSEVLTALNASINQDTKSAMSQNVQSMKETIFNLANEEMSGQYLFSGSSTSVQPFEMDSEGNVSYVGNSDYKTTLVDDNLYKEQGSNGFDILFYTTDEASLGDTMTFSESERLLDSNGDEWMFVDYDGDGVVDNDRIYLNGDSSNSYQNVTDLGTTPSTYSFANSEDVTIEAKQNYFDVLDEIINALDSKDSDGNAITEDEARDILSASLEKMESAFDSINTAHAVLGAKNASFENYSISTSSKITHYEVLYQDFASADLTQAAIQAQALETTYSALYSTISKVNSLSLVNFL